MSRTGTYWTDDRDRLNCAHGVILHGTRCVQCERGELPGDTPAQRSFVADAVRAALAGKFAEGGFVPRSMGFDTASGPDHHVEVEMTRRRAGEDFVYTVDDIKTSYEFRQAMNGDNDRMDAMQERIREATRRLSEEMASRARGRDYYRMPDPPYDFGENVYSARDEARKRWEHSRGDPRPRAHAHWQHWPGNPFNNQIEVITDPNDTRGVNARRVGDRRYAAQS